MQRSQSARSKVPGPGNYEIKPKFGPTGDAPKITMSIGRPKSAEVTNVPGPGAYSSGFVNKPTSPHYK